MDVLTIEKSDKNKEKDWYISGYASTKSRDTQGDIVEPEGLDYESYFQKNGWITYEHQHDMASIVGEPTKLGVDDKGLRIEAKLYKSIPRAQEIWKLQKALAKESEEHRALGFSIEARVKSRSMDDPHIITSAILTAVTITSHPANLDAKWRPVEKSAEVGYDTNPATMTGATALAMSNVAQSINVLSYTMSRADSSTMLKFAEDSLRKAGCLNKNTLSLLLQVGRGISKADADTFIDKNLKGVLL